MANLHPQTTLQLWADTSTPDNYNNTNELWVDTSTPYNDNNKLWMDTSISENCDQCDNLQPQRMTP
jgi:ribulose kinase